MFNLIKAQNYQMIRSNATILTFIICIAFAFIPFVGMDSSFSSDITGGLYTTMYLEMMIFVIMIISMVLVTRVMGWDFADKTINYEVLAGHSRGEVFFARFLDATVWGILGTLGTTILSIGVVSLLYGWGNEVLFSEFLIRYLYIIVVAFRFICFCALVTILMKNHIAAGLVSFMLAEGSVMVQILSEEVLNINCKHWFALGDMFEIAEVTNSRNIIENGIEISRYDMSMEPGYVLTGILVSLVISAVYIGIAYYQFKKRDMR